MSTPATTARPAEDLRGSLSWHATELYDDLRLMPMLRKLVSTSCALADAVGGSVSIVNPRAGLYTKIAELGTNCRLGQSFPLHEGVTGRVMDRRAPVILSAYRDLETGHLASDHPAWDGAVAAVPIWWRGDIVAVNVIFAGVASPFSMDEVDHLELVSQVVAPGLVTAIGRELPDVPMSPPHTPEGHAGAGAAGRSASQRTAPLSVDDVTLSLIELAERVTRDRGSESSPHVHVRIAGYGGRPRLLIENLPQSANDVSGAPVPVWQEVVDGVDGPVALQQATDPRVIIDVESKIVDSHRRRADVAVSPCSSREQEVLRLLARGLSDRAIAGELCLSPKTVEKHVSAVLRKTGTTSRTAAVVYCIEQGWLQTRD